MSLSSVEEERLDALKQWWQRYGTLLTAAIVAAALVVGGYYGWQLWEDRQLAAASEVYSEVLAARQADDPEAFAAAYERLRTEYTGTPYAADAALLFARDRYQAGAVEQAMAALRWVADHAEAPSRRMTATYRLARLQLEEGNPDAALETAQELEGRAFRAAAAELEGDAWSQKDDPDRAREAYERALEELDESAVAYTLVEMKLLDLGGGES